MIALALLLFYTLLLSLSEHITFEYAYLIAGASVILLVTTYAKILLGGIRRAGLFGIVLTALYCFLYIIVRAQDYALLFGSFGLFVGLAIIMYLTRNIDWFVLGKKEE